MRTLIIIAALVASVSAIAQAFPLYGVARYGEARFAASDSSVDLSGGSATGGSTTGGTAGEDALVHAVPSIPLWATITLAVLLWTLVYLMRKKESAND